MGRRGYGGGGRWRVYTYRYTVTTRITCIKMGSDESHFNVSLVVRNKVTRPCPQTTTFLKRKESQSGIEPRSFRLPAYRLTARPNRLSCESLADIYIYTHTTVHSSSVYTRLCHKALLWASYQRNLPANVKVSTSSLISASVSPRPSSSLAVSRMSKKSRCPLAVFCSASVSCSWTKVELFLAEDYNQSQRW